MGRHVSGASRSESPVVVAAVAADRELPRVPETVSPTLAANEALAARRARGEPVLPMAFGEAGIPVHPALRAALAEAAMCNRYPPVAGTRELRTAAAGYWDRRGLPTNAADVVCGPGSKAMLYGLLLAVGADVAVASPSWVSYAAQASMTGNQPRYIPIAPDQGGAPEPALLAESVAAAAKAGRRIASVIVTLPDNPTGTLAAADTIRDLCQVAADYDLVIISDEIYRDLVYDPPPEFPSPARFAPERTVITTGLSKSLALGGWRIGVARFPGQPAPALRGLRDRLLAIGSEIWSALAGPMQQAAAYAFSEPPELAERVGQSRLLHAGVARAAAAIFAAAGVPAPAPAAAFYLYPDFGPWREHLAGRFGVTTSQELAAMLSRRYGLGVLPGSAFGDDPAVLRLRAATSMLYGDTDSQREESLAAADPLRLPWIQAALNRLAEILADLAPSRYPRLPQPMSARPVRKSRYCGPRRPYLADTGSGNLHEKKSG